MSNKNKENILDQTKIKPDKSIKIFEINGSQDLSSS